MMDGVYGENECLYDMQKRLMSQQEIFAYNQEIVQIPECQMKDLTSEDAARAAGVKAFGIVVNETHVRAEPTDEPLYQSAEKTSNQHFFEDDMRQLSSMRVGEGVWILNILDVEGVSDLLKKSDTGKIKVNQNKKWLYVQGRNYAGWIHTDSVGRCSFAEMKNYLTTKNFVTVLKPTDVYIEDIHLEVHFSMGSRLLKKQTAHGQDEAVLCPVSVHGQLAYARLFKAEHMHRLEFCEGYLPFTSANLLWQAQELLETPYRWGNANGGLDCSGMVVAVYDCFGLTLPRDSSRMLHCPKYIIPLETIPDEISHHEKFQPIPYITSINSVLQQLTNIYPGSLLFFPGHVMMYAGMKEGIPYIIHALSRYQKPDGSECPVRKCVLSPFNLMRPSGVPYLEALTHIFCLR